MTAKLVVLSALFLSLISNFHLAQQNAMQETQLTVQQKRIQLIINDDGEYLNSSIGAVSQSIKPVDLKSLDCLATNIYREAATESMAGKIAVGQVVINRIKSKHYPGDVCSVVYQKTRKNNTVSCQFSWVCNKKLPAIEKHSTAWKKSLRAAHTVLSYDTKIIPDITNGATHYHAHWVNPDWKNALKLTTVIDQHRFYRVL
jgi:spore germination cell wall hydrolase CwlJ-like protein